MESARVSTIGSSNEQYQATLTYNRYNENGNLEQYTTLSGVPISIVWGYHGTLPIAKIEGATYSEVANYISDIIQKSNNDFTREDEKLLLSALDTFRKQASLAKARITTYTYDPLVGVSSLTPPSGVREVFSYDTSNRLKSMMDVNSNFIFQNKYNYNSPKVYYNTEKSQTFTRNNCFEGFEGRAYTYTVPANTYISTLSVQEANQKALSDIASNGQLLANRYGACRPIVVKPDPLQTSPSLTHY